MIMVDDKEKEPELEIVEVAGEGTEDGPKKTAEAADKKPDPKVPVEDDDDDDDDVTDEVDSERLGTNDDDESAESLEVKRNRRREAKKRSRLKKARMLSALEEQNSALVARLSQIESGMIQRDGREIEKSMSEANANYHYADRKFQEAIAAGDGELAAKAQRAKEEASARYHELDGARQRVAEQPRRGQQPKPGNPVIKAHADAWKEDHEWYGARGNEEDTAIVDAIDKSLSREGYDPTSEEYWRELTKRAKKRIPDRAEADGDESDPLPTKKKAGPPVSGGKKPSANSGKVQVRITPERKTMLTQLGVWGDAAAMKPYLASFAEYDKQRQTR